MKIGVCITMYNENKIVEQTITSIKNYFGENSYIVVIHSDGSNAYPIELLADYYLKLSNLSASYERHKVPSYALTRNYGKGFSQLYSTKINFDYVVGLCGDTLVTDASNFDRRFNDMKNNDKLACVSQAIGQNFHAPDADPINGKCGGRMQIQGITDIMPQFFILDGKTAILKEAFTNIEVVNEFTSEHCLGNELVKMVGDFSKKVFILSSLPYDYNDGICYQAG